MNTDIEHIVTDHNGTKTVIGRHVEIRWDKYCTIPMIEDLAVLILTMFHFKHAENHKGGSNFNKWVINIIRLDYFLIKRMSWGKSEVCRSVEELMNFLYSASASERRRDFLLEAYKLLNTNIYFYLISAGVVDALVARHIEQSEEISRATKLVNRLLQEHGVKSTYDERAIAAWMREMEKESSK